ncbi:ABC transporter ATP-binding protein [Kiritimatiellaeota bacterium B1221]|nr:ABC transporter ATP-binding protein [Kiritimatiellaeota bacterium B1221]
MSKKKPLEKRPIRRLYQYSLKHRGRLSLGVLLGVIGGASFSGVLASLSRTTNTAFGEVEVEKSLDAIFSTGSGFWIAAGLLLGFFLLSGLCGYFSIYFINYVGFKVVEDLRRQTFHHLQLHQMRFYGKHSSGELISRVTNDTMMVQHAVSGVVADIVRQPALLVSAVGYMLYVDPMLTLISVVVFPISVAPVIILGRKVRKYSRQGQEYMAGLSKVLQENVSGVMVVKSFGMEPYEEEKFNVENQNVFGRLIKTVLARHVNQPLMEFVAGLGIVAIMMYVRVSHLGVGEFFSFAAALGVAYQPVKMLSKVHMEIQKAMGSAERIFELLDEPIDVVEPENGIQLTEPFQELAFDKVSFRYDEANVLNEIDLTIKAGEKVALVGSSGSGKTTLTSLVPRFYDPSEGTVRLNGKDLKSYSFEGLRSQIALVTQDTFLFNDTILQNIAYGQEEPDIAKVEDAARRAHAHNFISEMEEGYQTLVGERGGRLSGGQKQRLAIARAIYRDAPILILDEATSALDTESERLVQSAINEMMKGRTSIAIAHRLSTIQHADRILVMQEGRIVEAGNHQTLLDKDGVYRRLYDMQFAG